MGFRVAFHDAMIDMYKSLGDLGGFHSFQMKS